MLPCDGLFSTIDRIRISIMIAPLTPQPRISQRELGEAMEAGRFARRWEAPKDELRHLEHSQARSIRYCQFCSSLDAYKAFLHTPHIIPCPD